MPEIINFAKAKAAREAQGKVKQRKVSLDDQIDQSPVVDPILDLGRFHYGLGLLADDDKLKQIGADALVETEGMHQAGQAIENMELKHKIRNKSVLCQVKPVEEQ